MKKASKLLCLLMASALFCSLFTGCEKGNQKTGEFDALAARNNALACKLPWIMMDETNGVYVNSMKLVYIDTKSGTGAPVCVKPECEHVMDDRECFSNRMLDAAYIYYYQDHLYYGDDNLLFRCGKVGTDEKVLADFDELLNDEVKAVLKERDDLHKSACHVNVRGVYGGKLYILAVVELSGEDGYVARSVQALYVCDPDTGAVERCADKNLSELIDEKPSACEINVSICGELMFVERYMSAYNRSEKGEIELYAYNMRSKKIVKERSVPDEGEDTKELSPMVNADETFLLGKRADGKTTYTEYDGNLKKTAEFILESDYEIAKDGKCYYACRGGDKEIIRYSTETKKTDKLLTDGTFSPRNTFSLLGIIDGKMIGTDFAKDDCLYALMDVSCFDTGKFEMQPVEGISFFNVYGYKKGEIPG